MRGYCEGCHGLRERGDEEEEEKEERPRREWAGGAGQPDREGLREL